jgi:hypothetical protein
MRLMVSAVVVLLLGTGVYAHHSHPDFLTDQRATIEGRIESLKYENPHSQMTVLTADATLYTIEWRSAGQLRLPGTNCFEKIYSETLNVGDHVIVVGLPPRDPLRHELANVKQVYRPKDGWSWFLEGRDCLRD